MQSAWRPVRKRHRGQLFRQALRDFVCGRTGDRRKRRSDRPGRRFVYETQFTPIAPATKARIAAAVARAHTVCLVELLRDVKARAALTRASIPEGGSTFTSLAQHFIQSMIELRHLALPAAASYRRFNSPRARINRVRTVPSGTSIITAISHVLSSSIALRTSSRLRSSGSASIILRSRTDCAPRHRPCLRRLLELLANSSSTSSVRSPRFGIRSIATRHTVRAKNAFSSSIRRQASPR